MADPDLDTQGAGSANDWHELARLLELAQTGGAAEVLAETDRLLSTPDGRDGLSAALGFARVVALQRTGDQVAAIAAIDHMLEAARREGSAGWRSIALSSRSSMKFTLGELDPTVADLDSVLRDVVEADALVRFGVDDPYVASNASTGIALAYAQMRLYELAVPHHEAAYEHDRRNPSSNGGSAMCQSNLAQLHLVWALELYRVGLDAEAEEHCRTAGDHARQVVLDARGDQTDVWLSDGRLFGACARADGPDPRGVADEIRAALDWKLDRGMTAEPVVYPYLAIALHRTGRTEEALAAIDEGAAACDISPHDTPWVMHAGIKHTKTLLLAKSGSPDLVAALDYGDQLAGALWRERERTLRHAQTLQRYETLRAEHEAVSRTAELDPLTGVANRRGFDRQLQLTAVDPNQTSVSVLLVDVDKFKQVNDTFGHSGGDAALRAIATVLQQSARDGDVVARLGGDEFALLLLGADATASHRVGERIVGAVAAEPRCRTSVSVGVASGASSDVEVLLEQADRAMYEVKRTGRAAVSAVATAAGVGPQRTP